jgi:hypothetical protein
MTIPDTIEGEIADTMLEVLTYWCITNVDAEDPSRANHVILGKPTSQLSSAIVVSIHMLHPLSLSKGGEDLVEGTPRTQKERPYQFPPETWGGMRTELLVGAVQVNYREKEDYEGAIPIISRVTNRVKQGINQDSRLAYLTDDMGNFMSEIETFTAEGVQSGGDNITVDRHWVSWRAWVHSTHARTVVS